MNSPDPVRRNLYLVLGAFFVVALGIGAAGYGYYLNQKAEIKRQQRNELAAIAQLKMGQIANWRRERLSDARVARSDGNRNHSRCRRVRKLVVEALNRYGYRVLKTEKGSEALLLAQSFSEPIHLMVTDVIMPGMIGAQLADRMRELRPDMKVMYMSGYSENVIAHQGFLDPGLAYLPKPFTPAALAQKVRAVLAAT